MTSDNKKAKTNTAPKADTPAKTDTAAKADTAAKSDAAYEGQEFPPAEDASKSKVEEPAGAAPANYSRGEGQKAVTAAYRENWNAIFAKKTKEQRRRASDNWRDSAVCRMGRANGWL